MHGHDQISICMSKICGNIFFKPLECTFRQCLNTGLFPVKWMESNLVPIYCGCSYGEKLKFLYMERKFYYIQINIFIFKKSLILLRQTFSYLEKMLLHSEKHFDILINFYIFREIFCVRENFIFTGPFIFKLLL